jgi:hypothetical protein
MRKRKAPKKVSEHPGGLDRYPLESSLHDCLQKVKVGLSGWSRDNDFRLDRDAHFMKLEDKSQGLFIEGRNCVTCCKIM